MPQSPTSTISYIGNNNPGTFIEYSWVDTPDVSKFGSYSGSNSDTTLTFGFRPAFVLIKCTNNSGDWVMKTDVSGNNQYLLTNKDQAESTGYNCVFTDTGITLGGNYAFMNKSGFTYIYAAFSDGTPIEVLGVDLAANTMSVDGGDWFAPSVWNQSSEWSSYVSASAPVYTGTPADAFDGDETTEYGLMQGSGTPRTTVTFNLTGLVNPRIKYKNPVGSGSNFVITTNLGAVPMGSEPSLAWKALPAGTTEIIKTEATGGGGSQVVSVSAIESDGKLLVDQSVTPPGATEVTGESLIASANDVEYLDNNTLGVNGVSGTWISGLYAKGAQVTATAPSPSSIQYTSANGTPLTTAFSGTDATLSTRTWTWQESNAVTGPWTTFATRTDTPGQDGATPLANKPTLAENKFYQVKVRYDSNNAEYVESTFNTFKTGTN